MSDLATRCCKGVSVARLGAAFAEAGSRSGLRTGSLGRGSDGGVTDVCGPLLSARVDGIAGSARLAMLGPTRLALPLCARASGPWRGNFEGEYLVNIGLGRGTEGDVKRTNEGVARRSGK